MEIEIKIKMNERLFLRDPEATKLGKKIIRQSILMIESIGFEDFTFKKLAQEIGTTEAGIYRYFENKHRVLVYILSWYWNLFEYQLQNMTQKETDASQNIKNLIYLLSNQIETKILGDNVDCDALHHIVIYESNKAYLHKNISDNNESQFFKPYKDVCNRISHLFLDFNSDYAYSHSLASTVVEMSHLQKFFMLNLPSLTDFGKSSDTKELSLFLEDLVFSSLEKKKN